MGAYLNKPILDKHSSDGANDRLSYGVCSMQGWRESQEDAHTCILDFDNCTSFFAVFDGHGGGEVADYCSSQVPEFLKSTEAYKKGDFENALIDTYLGVDALIDTPEALAALQLYIKELRKLIKTEEPENADKMTDSIYRDASFPLDEIIDQYRTNILEAINSKLDDEDKIPLPLSVMTKKPAEKNKTEVVEENCVMVESECNILDSVNVVNGESVEFPSKNNEATTDTNNQNNGTQENGTSSTKGTENSAKNIAGSNVADVIKSKAIREMYAKLLNLDSASIPDDEDEEETDVDSSEYDSSDEEINRVGVILNDNDEEDEVSDESETLNESDDEKFNLDLDFSNKPGFSSGCTAVAALIVGANLYVANAGDSRCIISSKGKAIDLSIDHKPKNKVESRRIHKAGGKINSGRVFYGKYGGLNLTRSIGDLHFKINKNLSPREQMITALPDVRVHVINPAEDEFIVLACDGIWDGMSSQQVVDFIRPRIQSGTSLKMICEELFDATVAKDSVEMDGTDNMSAIIVDFKANISKQPDQTSDCSSSSKKMKTECNSQLALET